MLATDTTEGGFFSGVLEKRVVPTVIKQPQAEKDYGNEQAECNGSEDEIHWGYLCLNRARGANRTARDPASV
jgi:hypothetical protein